MDVILGFMIKLKLKQIKHSKWLVKIYSEKDKVKMFDFASSARVAHSTKKNLLFAIVDSQGEVSFFESSWVRV